jgi:hypothetical protein
MIKILHHSLCMRTVDRPRRAVSLCLIRISPCFIRCFRMTAQYTWIRECRKGQAQYRHEQERDVAESGYEAEAWAPPKTCGGKDCEANDRRQGKARNNRPARSQHAVQLAQPLLVHGLTQHNHVADSAATALRAAHCRDPAARPPPWICPRRKFQRLRLRVQQPAVISLIVLGAYVLHHLRNGSEIHSQGLSIPRSDCRMNVVLQFQRSAENP